jgi:hypothetical protein
MSFSTPAMTGSSEFRESKNEMPYGASPYNSSNAENPWKLKLHSACTPQSAFSPWQVGAPSAYSPWQVGAPSTYNPMSLHANYARPNPWSEIIPTTAGLAPVDIQVLSESEQADAEKNQNLKNVPADSSKKSINWSSAEELAEALFPTTGEQNAMNALKEHAEALSNHKDEIEDAHYNIGQHTDALLNHRDEIEDARYNIKEHKKVFENHKLNIEKLRSKVNSNLDLQHEVFLNHKSEIEKLATVSKASDTDIRKKILQHDDSLKRMKNEFEEIKLRMSNSTPDTQAKLRDLHLRTRQLETTHKDKLERLEEKLDSETKFLKTEIKKSLSADPKQISFNHLTAPRRQK